MTESIIQYKSHLFSLIDAPLGVEAILFGHNTQKIEQGESWSVLDLFEYYCTTGGFPSSQTYSIRYKACYIHQKLPPRTHFASVVLKPLQCAITLILDGRNHKPALNCCMCPLDHSI